MSRYVKDMRGRVVQAPTYRPSGDQNPEGKAATRRRKQMERQLRKAVGPIELMDRLDKGIEQTSIRHSDVTTCDGCGLDATDACPHCQAATCGECGVCEHWQGKPRVVDQCLDGGAIRTWMDDDGEIRQEYTPKEQLVLESNPTNGPGLAQRLFVNRLMDNADLTHLLSAKPGACVLVNDPASLARMVEAGTVSVGVDPARPDGDVTTVAIRSGRHVVIHDEYGPVPAEAWDAVVKRARDKADDSIATAMTGGAPIPVNTAPRPAAIKPRMGLGLTRGILAAALLATLGTDKPKE